MRLLSQTTRPSPDHPGFFRVDLRIEVETRQAELAYWFDFPADLETDLGDTANGCAILMLPLACYFGEVLELDQPVDRVLLDNLRGIQQVWAAWYPELEVAPIRAPTVESTRTARTPGDATRTLSSFSGGIDSFFTLLRHDKAPEGDGHFVINDLLCVAGFNTPIDDLDPMRAALEPIAHVFERRLIPVATNVRYGAQSIETPYSIDRLMIGFAHACVLAAIPHLLDRRYREYIIPASHHFANLMPYGSHPLTDPLLSSSGLAVVHDGASFTRIERTERVAQSDAALTVLHVCWQNYETGNCSRCQKCVRTMAALDLMGARARATSFDWSNYSLDSVSHMWCNNPSDTVHYVDIAEAAINRGRIDLAEAAWASVRFSRRKQAILRFINSTLISRKAWQTVRRMRQTLGLTSQ